MKLTLGLLGGFLMALTTLAAAKTAPTYYTPERVACGRENLAKQRPFAVSAMQRIMKGDSNTYYIGREYGQAAECIKQTDDFIWLMQPSTTIPRVPPNHETNALCPIHGEKVREKNAWTAWTTDPIGHPYKVRCRLGGEWYPSNDFMNGDLTSGEFPDDGSGCKYQGKTYHFLKEYAHMAYGNNTIPCLRSLSQAWLLTGDKQYARKGCILLARLATEYPNFTDRKDRLFYGPYGGRDPHYTWKTGGMITDFIWESFCLEATAYAYDGLYNYMDQDPELIAFLQAKGMPIKDGNDLRRYIEDNILRVGMQALLNGHIEGNEGFYQASAMSVALVLDDHSDTHPNSRDMVDFAFHGKGHAAFTIVNGTNRDGSGHESPGYNSIKFDFIRVNRLMEDMRKLHPDLYPLEQYPDLFGNAKGKGLFDHFIDMTIFHMHMPSIGDSGAIQPPYREKPNRYSYVSKENLYGFERYKDPRLARAATKLDGTLSGGELFEPYPEDEIRAALATPESQIKFQDRVLDGYGVGILEVGDPTNGKALALNYASIIGHRQMDNLNLELFARGVNILPDLGYPYTWDYRDWDSGSMSHNTVTVDETQPAADIGGQCNLFATEGGVHVISARHDPYPAHDFPPASTRSAGVPPASGVDLYERTSVLIEVDADRFYVVDLFAVNGGSQHDQSWHGPLTKVQPPTLQWQEQPQGTLAGPDVALAARYTDKWGRKTRNFPSYLSQVKRATLAEPAVWNWDYGLPEGDRLALHVIPVGGPAEIITGVGRSPARPADWGLDYLLVRRQARAQKPSLFLTVLDAYQKTPVVQSVRLVQESPLKLEITRADGVDEITFTLPAGPSRTTTHRPLSVAVQIKQADKPARQVQFGNEYAQSTIAAVDYQKNEISLNTPAAQDATFAPGRYVRLYNPARSAMYRVVTARRDGNQLRLTLDSTPLLAQGPVCRTADDSLWLKTLLTFANGQSDDKGNLKPGRNDYFAGAWLGEGADARRLAGAIRDNPTRVFFEKPATQAALDTAYAGKLVNIWQYGVGDSAEAPVVR
ncbi:MAG: heparinase II/III family protein [Armatimonadia bacterium]